VGGSILTQIFARNMSTIQIKIITKICWKSKVDNKVRVSTHAQTNK
jgi:hypothetical protein